MRTKTLIAAAVLALPLAGQAAGVVYAGDLVSGVPQEGAAGGFSWFLDQGEGVQFWRFESPVAGLQLTLRVDRLNANLDPGLTLYQGVTGADTSGFDSGGSWGGLGFIGTLDDENPPHLGPGPHGDPLGSFWLASGGWYTVAVGGGLSTDAASYPYRITMTLVPEPAPAAMLAAGLATLLWARRRRRG